MNKNIIVEYPDSRLVFRSKEKTYIVHKEVWNELFKTYGSTFVIEKSAPEAIKCYKHTKAKKLEGSFEEIPFEPEFGVVNTVEDYLATEKDTVFPYIQQQPQPKVLLKKCPSCIAIQSYSEDRKRINESIIVNIKKETSKETRKRREQEAADDGIYLTQSSIEEPVRKQVPPIGLKNYGTNCYANAGLQCLFSVPEFNAYFLSEQFDNIEHNTKKKEKKVCKALSSLYKSMFKGDHPTCLAPKTLLTLLPSGQQDTHEFFWKKLFPSIQDETNPHLKEPRREDMSSKESWNWYKRNHTSILDSLFAGQYESQVVCKTCSFISVTYDPFMDISLPALGKTIDSCFEDYFADDFLSKKEAYKCSKCKNTTAATKRMRIDKNPSYLLVHIKRLVGGYRKINTHIEYNIELDIAKYSYASYL